MSEISSVLVPAIHPAAASTSAAASTRPGIAIDAAKADRPHPASVERTPASRPLELATKSRK